MTQQWLAAHCQDFTDKDSRPPNSPDINPLDYHVWGSMLQNFCHLHLQPKDISELKSALVKILEELPQDAIWKSIANFRKRLRACVNADGGHFEHLLYHCWLIWLMFAVFATLKAKGARNVELFINFTAMFSWNICIKCSILYYFRSTEVNEVKLVVLQTVNYSRNSAWNFGRKIQNHWDTNAFCVVGSFILPHRV